MSWDGVMSWGLQTGLMVSLLIVFILVIRRPFAKAFGARAAYGLWALPILRLFMPTLTLPAIFTTAPEPVMSDLITIPLYTGPAPIPATDWAALLTPWVIAVWAVGTLVFIYHHYLRQARLQRDMAAMASQPSSALSRIAQKAAGQTRLNSSPKIYLIPQNIGPMVSHLFSPIIYLPQDFEQSFTPEQQTYALLHEMAHIRRGDLWAAWGWLIFRAINWPNPLVHFASRAFRSDQEAACDATVLALTDGAKTTHIAYAETLLRAAEAAVKPGRASPATPELALTIHQPLKERLIMLTQEKTRPSWLIRSGATALIIAAFGLTAPLTMAENHPDSEVKTEKHIRKSVMQSLTNDNGKEVKRHIEVTVDGDTVTAFEIDEDGNKTAIDPDELEEFDMEILTDDVQGRVKMMTRQNFDQWREGDFKEWKDGDFAKWSKDFKDHSRHTIDKDGKRIFVMPRPPHAPMPPGLTRLEDSVIIAMDDKNGFSYRFGGEARLQSAESLLEAAEDMISEMNSDGMESRKLAKARRDLERARKSLADAQAELEESE